VHLAQEADHHLRTRAVVARKKDPIRTLLPFFLFLAASIPGIAADAYGKDTRSAYVAIERVDDALLRLKRNFLR
jgi:hypothetical protein